MNRATRNANKAKELYRQTPPPSPQRFIELLNSNYFGNCLLTPVDTKRAKRIYDTNLVYLQGKRTQMKSEHVQGIPNNPPPYHIPDMAYIGMWPCVPISSTFKQRFKAYFSFAPSPELYNSARQGVLWACLRGP